jgi:hypothetical protein
LVFSGGGYFRLLPEWYLLKLFKSQKYVMTYFHPRDFDNNQPVIPGIAGFRKMKSYIGIDKCLSKLDKVLPASKYHSIADLKDNAQDDHVVFI